MFADQFKLTIVVGTTLEIDRLDFTVCYAEEGSNDWVALATYSSRKEANAFVDGIEFRDSNAI